MPERRDCRIVTATSIVEVLTETAVLKDHFREQLDSEVIGAKDSVLFDRSTCLLLRLQFTNHRPQSIWNLWHLDVYVNKLILEHCQPEWNYLRSCFLIDTPSEHN